MGVFVGLLPPCKRIGQYLPGDREDLESVHPVVDRRQRVGVHRRLRVHVEVFKLECPVDGDMTVLEHMLQRGVPLRVELALSLVYLPQSRNIKDTPRQLGDGATEDVHAQGLVLRLAIRTHEHSLRLSLGQHVLQLFCADCIGQLDSDSGLPASVLHRVVLSRKVQWWRSSRGRTGRRPR